MANLEAVGQNDAAKVGNLWGPGILSLQDLIAMNPRVGLFDNAILVEIPLPDGSVGVYEIADAPSLARFRSIPG
jgi:hypothetical protein